MTYYRPEDTAIVPYETVITCGPDEGIDVEQAAAVGGHLASAGS